MTVKPRTIIHNIEDSPSFFVQLGLGLQLLVKFSIMIMFPLLVAEYAGISLEATVNFISISLIAGAVSTILQAMVRPKIAAGQLLPTFTSVPYFIASLTAAYEGGLSLVLGMTIIGGIIQLALTPLIRRFKFIFTRDVAAFILILLGFWLGVLGVQELFNPSELGQLAIHNSLLMQKTPALYKKNTDLIGYITLSIIIILRLWSPQKLRLYCILIGMIIGWGLACLHGYIPAAGLLRLTTADWLHLPQLVNLHYSFKSTLLFPFFLAALITCFEYFALICANEKGVDNDWSSPDLPTIRRGNFWMSITHIVAGSLGSVAQSPLPGAVGVSIATGAYSRNIAYFFAIGLLLLSCSPKMIAFFLTIPAGVNGAAVTFIGASLFMLGVNMINLKSANSRKTYAIGIAFLIASSSDIIPAIYNPFPALGVVATDPALLLGLFCFIFLTILFSFKPTTEVR